MKKILMGLAASSLIATLSTQVVSCGPATFSKLMARQINPTTFKGTFAAPMTSWSAATTQTASDSWILTNANDRLISPDQYNNFEGDLADNWGVTTYSGADPEGASQDYRSWGFHVRTGEIAPVWTKLDRENRQEAIRPIVASDFFNTFRFVFNPNNISQTVGVWQQIIDYGQDLNSFLTYIRTSPTDWPEGGTHPYPELYDQRFSRLNDPGTDNGIAQSSFFIDRAILAFNLNPARATDLSTMMAVKNQALAVPDTFNTNYSAWTQLTQALVEDSFANGKIINKGDGNNYNLAYNLLKPAEYFESMASFLSFAPMPDEAVDYLNTMRANMAGTNYGSPKATGEFGYQQIYYSGAYVVSDYNPSSKLVMVKNNYYFNKKNVPIETLSYSYTGNVDISRQRFYFETGDLSEFMVSSSDLSGWKKYVGADANDPRFQGANITNRPQAGTQALFFNYNSTRSEPQTDRANQALAQRSTRAFIRYIFDRSEPAKFYSKALDGDQATSHNLRNTWTSPNVGLWKNPDNEQIDYVKFLYQDYMKLPTDDLPAPPPSSEQTIVEWLKQKLALDDNQFNEWSNRFGTAESENDNGEMVERSSWIDGFDPYLRNDLIGAYTFLDENRTPVSAQEASPHLDASPLLNQYVPLIGNYSTEAETQKLELIKQEVKDDLAAQNIATSPVDLVFLANGATSTGLNNYTKLAVQTFNFRVGSDSPIHLQVVESKDASDYSSMLDRGAFSMIIFGWISDYADPYGFLHAIVYNGDIAEYAGFSRLFDAAKVQTQQGEEVTLTTKASVANPAAYEDLRQRLQYFTNQSAKIDLTVPTSPDRYFQMAQVENATILEGILLIPLLTQYLDNVPYVSYVNPFSRSTFASGQAIYRFVGVTMVDKLWDHATFKLEKEKHDRARNSYKSMYPGTGGRLITVKNGDWRQSNK